MTQLCVSTFVFGGYKRFIPYYVYSVLKAYPEYYIKIFVDGTISDRERNCLSMLRNDNSNNFEIRENYFSQLSKDSSIKRNTQQFRALRWLIPASEFDQFDYVYTGDIDFLIFKEIPGLLEYHLEHCYKTGLPFSNSLRINQDGTPRKQLSGLHFIITKSYYELLQDVISYYSTNTMALIAALNQCEEDEKFLYNLVSQRFDIRPLMEKNNFRPYHGVHLGAARLGSREYFLETLRECSLVSIEILRDNLNSILHDRVFQKLFLRLPEETVVWACQYCGVEVPMIIRYYYALWRKWKSIKGAM